jgi:hypothetical protein
VAPPPAKATPVTAPVLLIKIESDDETQPLATPVM